MFTKSIIESDAFLDLPVSARLLYFDLGMRGDDDGFVDSPKRIMRLTGASDDDLKILIAKQFLIPFDSGVVVIRHWGIHNYIRPDRYKPTQYQLEKSALSKEKGGAYASCLPLGIPSDNQVSTTCQPNGYVTEQNRIEGNRTEDNRDDGNAVADAPASTPAQSVVILLSLNDKAQYPIYEEQVHEWAALYPAVDVIQQLRHMRGWLDANPSKRKTKSGILRFINSWLAREQDKGHMQLKHPPQPMGGLKRLD